VPHFGNFHYISTFFIITTFVMAICDQWLLMLLFWGGMDWAHIRRQTLDKQLCSDCSTYRLFCLLSSSGLPTLNTTMLKLGQLITLRWPLSAQRNQKLGMI
jgi:hypothetical protein